MLYNININGYWIDVDRYCMPSCAGIYFVYACTFNPGPNTVNLRSLLYIGQASDINARLANHEKRVEWGKYLQPTETVCYSYAPVDGRSLDVVEAALVYKLQPPVNDQLKHAYLHAPAQLVITGQWPFPQLACFSVP